MLNLTLQRNDSIETVLPTVERAMRSGELCRLHNINYLGQLQLAALILLAVLDHLRPEDSGGFWAYSDWSGRRMRCRSSPSALPSPRSRPASA